MKSVKSKERRIVFMGTPEFAAAQLQALVQGGYNVVAAVTAPDKPAGRGMQLQQSAVKQYAVSQGITVLQPVKLRDEAFLSELKALGAELFIVVAFRMLPEAVWSMPRLGTFNLHASLLPDYRGAAPINWAIINGETETGVTTFFINEEIDSGKILLQKKAPIFLSDNAETLHDRLSLAGSGLVLKTVDGIVSGSISAVPQPKGSDSSYPTAPKLFKENTRLDWQKTARQLVNFVRGLSPHPAAWCELMVDGKPAVVKVFAAHAEACSANQPPGAVRSNGATFLKIRCADACLCVDELQLTGKKRMKIGDFLRGFRGVISN